MCGKLTVYIVSLAKCILNFNMDGNEGRTFGSTNTSYCIAKFNIAFEYQLTVHRMG